MPGGIKLTGLNNKLSQQCSRAETMADAQAFYLEPNPLSHKCGPTRTHTHTHTHTHEQTHIRACICLSASVFPNLQRPQASKACLSQVRAITQGSCQRCWGRRAGISCQKVWHCPILRGLEDEACICWYWHNCHRLRPRGVIGSKP